MAGGNPSSDRWFKGLSGHEINGKWHLIRYVAQGKIGFVYEAHRKDFPPFKVAVKLIKDQPRKGWENELEKVSILHGVPGVVKFHEVDTTQISNDGVTRVCQYSVWDWVPPGQNLSQYLKRHSPVSASFVFTVLDQILRVLHACYERGVKRHGDLHSRNILVGDPDPSLLNERLESRERIYVSDFGYGVTGSGKEPKDDYAELARIADMLIKRSEWTRAQAQDREIIQGLRLLSKKLLRELDPAERQRPLELLHAMQELQRRAAGASKVSIDGIGDGAPVRLPGQLRVGQFQVSEMLGERWDLWKRLFVPSVPARSRILEPDIPTVLTGPRGCGKTMLFRRLSERVRIECGDEPGPFVGFYINANDISDAFPSFPEEPSEDTCRALRAYVGLALLSEVIAVHSAQIAKSGGSSEPAFIALMSSLLGEEAEHRAPLEGEDLLGGLRLRVESLKWRFPTASGPPQFAGLARMGQAGWLPTFFSSYRDTCPWLQDRMVMLFVDDYTAPRVTESMQRVLNRYLLRRSDQFVAKLSTEAATTFLPADDTGKVLQDGDDFSLIDMGGESLTLRQREREAFLDAVFARRFATDPRVPSDTMSIQPVLGNLGISMTEFARRLRGSSNEGTEGTDPVPSGSQRRGRSRGRVLYHGADVFYRLWSGDTRTMIQIIQDLLDEGTIASDEEPTTLPLDKDVQDRVFRNRGGIWLEAQRGVRATRPDVVEEALAQLRLRDPEYQLVSESYGDHLKAIVEGFVRHARALLLRAPYIVHEGNRPREVPRTAFRIEIVDDFRLSGLARELYSDLIRYGLFMRDARGKSVRGAMVPRLYLRRFLLPYCTLALSQRDSVQFTCARFEDLLLRPESTPEQPISIDPSQLRIDLPEGDA